MRMSGFNNYKELKGKVKRLHDKVLTINKNKDNIHWVTFPIEKDDTCIYTAQYNIWAQYDVEPYRKMLPEGAEIRGLGKGFEYYMHNSTPHIKIKNNTWGYRSEFILKNKNGLEQKCKVLSISQTNDKQWLIKYMLIDKKGEIKDE